MSGMSLEDGSSLKAVCKRRELYAAVQAVGHAVTGRSPVQILSNILFKTQENGLKLIATDMELSISCLVPAVIESPGEMTTPAKTLADALANLPESSEVALSVDRSFTTLVHCDRSDFKMIGLPAAEYPRLPDLEEPVSIEQSRSVLNESVSYTVPQSVLKDMVRQTMFAVSKESARVVLTGLFLEYNDGVLRMVATDTHRLAVRTVHLSNGSGSRSAILPARTATELLRFLSDAPGDVDVRLASNRIAFTLPGPEKMEIVSSVIEGQYPNYARVIPAESSKRLVVNTQQLTQAARRALTVSTDSSMSFRVIISSSPGLMEVSAQNPLVGSVRAELDVEHSGGAIEIAFNGKYLVDALNAVETENVALDLTESLKPGVVRPVADPASQEEGNSDPVSLQSDYLCVIMPMQIA